MSDLNDLIHTNAHNAFGIGVKTERERILAIFSRFSNGMFWDVNDTNGEGFRGYPMEEVIDLIKGEQQ